MSMNFSKMKDKGLNFVKRVFPLLYLQLKCNKWTFKKAKKSYAIA